MNKIILKKMKKQTKILIVLGSICMSFTLLARHFISVPLSVDDFFKGLAVAFMFSALLLQRKFERKEQI